MLSLNEIAKASFKTISYSFHANKITKNVLGRGELPWMIVVCNLVNSLKEGYILASLLKIG